MAAWQGVRVGEDRPHCGVVFSPTIASPCVRQATSATYGSGTAFVKSDGPPSCAPAGRGRRRAVRRIRRPVKKD